MQAPPPTPNSGYLSLSGSPSKDRRQRIPNSLPTLAMILNDEIATMEHINNALMEHLNNDRVLERFESLNFAESDDDENNEKVDAHHRSRANGSDKKRTESPQNPSTNQSSPTDDHHPDIEGSVRAVPARHRRTYSANDIGFAAQLPCDPVIAREVARVFRVSEAEMRRPRASRR